MIEVLGMGGRQIADYKFPFRQICGDDEVCG